MKGEFLEEYVGIRDDFCVRNRSVVQLKPGLSVQSTGLETEPSHLRKSFGPLPNFAVILERSNKLQQFQLGYLANVVGLQKEGNYVFVKAEVACICGTPDFGRVCDTMVVDFKDCLLEFLPLCQSHPQFFPFGS